MEEWRRERACKLHEGRRDQRSILVKGANKLRRDVILDTANVVSTTLLNDRLRRPEKRMKPRIRLQYTAQLTPSH